MRARSTDKTSAPGAPAKADAPRAMQVAITRINRYARNPRLGEHPQYDRIKASIRAQGMDQPLVITCRPGDTDYVVHSGGNTRLKILQELYAETGEAQFYRVHCLVRPWTRESDVLLAHLRENDIRASLSFVDKARAIQDAKQLLAQELGVKEVLQTQLETALRKAGYRIHQGLISRMAYTVETLLPLIPHALEAGMGKHQVGRIRALERAARDLWTRCCAGGDSAFDTVFTTLCRRYDGPDWDTHVLQGAIETEIAEEAETSIQTVRVMLDAALEGRAVVFPETEPEPVAGPADNRRRHVERDGTATSEGRDEPGDREAGLVPAHIAPAQRQGAERVEAPEQTQDQPDDHAIAVTVPLAGPGDLKSLRGRAWTLAARLAQRNGIGDLITPLPGKGLGFVVRDVPARALAAQLDDDALGRITMLWWQLAACSEMTFAPLASIVPALPADSLLRRALEEQDAALLFNSVWTRDPGHTGYRLWRSLHDRDWRDLLNLMDTYRQIRRLAAGTGAAIWD